MSITTAVATEQSNLNLFRTLIGDYFIEPSDSRAVIRLSTEPDSDYQFEVVGGAIPPYKGNDGKLYHLRRLSTAFRNGKRITEACFVGLHEESVSFILLKRDQQPIERTGHMTKFTHIKSC